MTVFALETHLTVFALETHLLSRIPTERVSPTCLIARLSRLRYTEREWGKGLFQEWETHDNRRVVLHPQLAADHLAMLVSEDLNVEFSIV